MIATYTFEVGGFPVVVPVDEVQRAERLLFRGGFSCPKLAHDGTIRRVLDVAPGWGAFAIWSAHRWPLAWVDCLRWPSDEVRALCTKNAPMGARIEPIGSLADRYDIVHCDVDFDAFDRAPSVIVVEGQRGADLDDFASSAFAFGFSLAFADFDGPLATLTFTKESAR